MLKELISVYDYCKKVIIPILYRCEFLIIPNYSYNTFLFYTLNSKGETFLLSQIDVKNKKKDYWQGWKIYVYVWIRDTFGWNFIVGLTI